jgi:N-acetylmuramoyl-L-alanine amidase
MQEEYLDQSIMLADLVQKEFTNDLHRKDRGVKQNIFLVLRETYMPSVLVETGFLTNDAEGKFLNSKAGQNKMAEAIYEGIEAYKNNLNLKGLEVQIAAGSKPLETAAYNFNNLKGIERQKEGALYKYYFGSTSDYLRIQEKKREAESHGFSSCYIVAFKNGEKLAVNEALKTKAD